VPPPHVMTPTAILFDWDNTLVDAWAGVQAALNAAREAFDLPPWDRSTLLANVRLSLRDSFPKMFGNDWERARRIFSDTYGAQHLSVLTPLPDAEAAIAAAAKAGFAGVVSNKQGRFLRAEARALGWAEKLGALIGAGDAARDKPYPDQILLALAAARIAPGPHVWYVGDTGVDLAAARAAGVTAVLYGDGAHDGGAAMLGPDLHFPDHRALIAALEPAAA
jgi:phosphoglycolate phosphatase